MKLNLHRTECAIAFAKPALRDKDISDPSHRRHEELLS
jgi:hypothetical protein